MVRGRTRWGMTQFSWDVMYDGIQTLLDFFLEGNPRAMSHMVGYGNNFLRQVHYRASSIVSIQVDYSFFSCLGGYATWFRRKTNDPNVLFGAIVGGPNANNNFVDERSNYEQTEPATYNNAPLFGVLAQLGDGHSGYNQIPPVISLAPKHSVIQPQPAATPKVTPTPVSTLSLIAIKQKWKTS